MSFYGDLLRDYEKRYTKGFYGGLPVYLKFKTSPGENTTLAQTYKISRTVETTEDGQTINYNAANGATLKTTCCGKEVASKFKFGNSGVVYEVGYKPRELNNATQTVQFKHVSKFDAATTRVDSTESVKYGSPKVGPARLWLTLDFAWNNLNANKALKGSLNINKDEYNLGVKFDHDLVKQSLKSLNALFLYHQGRADYFGVFDILKKQFTLGCHHSHHDGKALHAYEIVYDIDGKLKGFIGQPAIVNWAGEYKITSDATIKSKLSLGAEWYFGYAWIHRFDNQIKLGFSHDLNVSKVLNGKGGATPYNFGASLQWTL